MARRRHRAAIGALLLAAAVLCGCSTLPTEGSVQSRPDNAEDAGGQAPYFAPPGPKPGDDRVDVVRGFLLAMQANPPSTAVARQFLSEDVRSTWNPSDGTIVYDSGDVARKGGTDQYEANLSDAHQLDRWGRWDTGVTSPPQSIDFSLVSEDGEWRISNPPDALAVPASYFPSLFVPFELYFYDRSSSVLVPVRVYLPRGRQTAANLVHGLLAGPPARLAPALTTALPGQADLDFGVLVSDAGVAEIPLSQAVNRMPPKDLERMLAQLAWTLRQVPGLTRIRVTVDGIPVPLPGGQSDVGVLIGAAYDPVALPDHQVLAIAGGRVVRVVNDAGTPVGGPLGRQGFALRSLALDAAGRRIAAVSRNGRQVYLAPATGAADPARVRPVVSGSDLLRPAFDRFGQLWTVDSTPDGAVVRVRGAGPDRVVTIPGVSGRRVSAFTITRDGSRFVAAMRGGDVPRMMVVPLVRDARGRFVAGATGQRIDVPAAGAGEVIDVGQTGPTTVAVLVRPTAGTARIVFAEVDGSPGDNGTAIPDLIPGRALGLVVGPDPGDTLRVFTEDRRLLELDPSGQWVRAGPADVRFAGFPQ